MNHTPYPKPHTQTLCLLFSIVAFLGCTDIPNDLRDDAKRGGAQLSSDSWQEGRSSSFANSDGSSSSFEGVSSSSSYDSPVFIPNPNSPNGVAAYVNSTSSISVGWGAVSDATGYYIYRSESLIGPYARVGTSETTSYTDDNLSGGTTYYYRISGYNSGGEGSQSSYVSATTAAASSSSTPLSSSSSLPSSSSTPPSSSSSLQSSSSSLPSSFSSLPSSSSVATYTVIYNAGTGVTGVAVPANQTKTHDVALTLSGSVPTRTGYVFANWNTSANGSGMSYASGASYTDNASVTLYAQWSYIVNYDANGGTGAPASQTKIHDVTLTLSTTVPTRTGYAFAGWTTLANGGGTSYASGASYTANAGVTLYAQWIWTYTVSYDANGGTNAPANQTKIHNVALTLNTAVPTRTNYVFDGWNTWASGDGTSYASGASYTANGDVTLYARWMCRPGIINGPSVSYGDETYESVVICEQTWLKRNLNYDVDGSKCYSNSETNCNKYGRLYDWATAMALPSSCNSTSCSSQVGAKHRGICPSGWHIPSDAEWITLLRYVSPGCTTYNNGVGTKLKATSGWNAYSEVPSGTDIYGFAALPGGDGYFNFSDGNFYGVGYDGSWWSARENDDKAYYWSMNYSDEDVTWSHFYKSSWHSVRCLQD